MATVQRFEDLEAWRTARRLVKEIYELTRTGSFARDFGLRDQIQRASVSVMSNIAEGFESRTQALFIDYLGRARASAGEVRPQLYAALDLGYITEVQFKNAFELADRSLARYTGLSNTSCPTAKVCAFMKTLLLSGQPPTKPYRFNV
ncbi:four helix bundle protein [Rhodocaloribacter sp.]